MTVYVCRTCPATYRPELGKQISFSSSGWDLIETLPKEQKSEYKLVLSQPKNARFIALAREGLVNLVEVEIYQPPCKYSLGLSLIVFWVAGVLRERAWDIITDVVI